MFLGLGETKRKPACIEFELSHASKLRIPPSMFFNDEARLKMIDEILQHYASNRVWFGT